MRSCTCLATISSLELSTFSLQGETLDALGSTYMLLAEASPALQKLRIDGNLPHLVLRKFGERCSKLTSLEVQRVCTGTFLRLQLLLPNLTHVVVLQPIRPDPPQPPAQHPAQPDLAFVDGRVSALSSCVALTSLHVGRQKLSHQVWRLLPRSLKELHCSLACPPPAGMDVFPALQHMHQHCTAGDDLRLQHLAALLRAAPNLLSLKMHCTSCNASLQVPCIPEVLPDLTLLHGLRQAGLQTFWQGSRETEHTSVFPIMFSCAPGVLGSADSSIEDFFTSLPCFPNFKTICIEYASSFPKRRDNDMRQMARVFPNLSSLMLDGNLCDADLNPLAACTKLGCMMLVAPRVTAMALAVLCCHLPALQLLTLCGSEKVSCSDGIAITDLLRSWGMTTKVHVS